jgi:hypothetical protein
MEGKTFEGCCTSQEPTIFGEPERGREGRRKGKREGGREGGREGTTHFFPDLGLVSRGHHGEITLQRARFDDLMVAAGVEGEAHEDVVLGGREGGREVPGGGEGMRSRHGRAVERS